VANLRLTTALLASIISLIASLQTARAACTDIVPGQDRECEGPINGDSFTPTAQWWAYDFLATPSPAESTGPVSVDNSGDFDGTFTMAVGTSIDPTTNVDALLVTNSTPADSFVTLNLNGEISNLDASNQNFAAVRLENGWSYEINIGATGVLVGNGDALVATAIANSLSISNAGTMTARGQGGGSDGGRAVFVAQGGTPDAKVAGAVTLNNTGTLESLATTLPGQAVHIAASGAINVTNAYQYSGDAPVPDTGRILGGTDGMRLISGTSVVVTNTALIEAAAGDGVQAVVDGTTGALTITNGVDDNGSAGVINTLAAGTSGGDGIDARITNAGSAANLSVNNDGTITAVGHGIVAFNAGLDPDRNVPQAPNRSLIAINNNSSQGITSALNGIDAAASGGAIYINNNATEDDDGVVQNGRIVAGQIGINAVNANAGEIYVSNGFDLTGSPVIRADGDYGISASSNGSGVGRGRVEVTNYGLIEAIGSSAIAAVHADTTTAVNNSYAWFDNGGLYGLGARVNAYGIDTSDPLDPAPVIYDAMGVELVKDGGTGGRLLGSRFYGTVFYNAGLWDFFAHEGGNYLTDTALGGGVYAPGGTAVRLEHLGPSDTFFFNNGTIIGEGDSASPVIDITTAYNVATPNRVVFTNDVNWDTRKVDNKPSRIFLGVGVIGSAALPAYFDFPDISAEGLIDADLTAFADAADDDLLHATGAPLHLDNSGLLVGRITLDTAAPNHIGNFGAWLTQGVNTFTGTGGSTLENKPEGVIRTAFNAAVAETTEFRDLPTLLNQGLISLIDDGVGDSFVHTGNFVGDNGRLGVDAYLGAAGSTADVVQIDGNVSGVTGIIVNDTNPGLGVYNPEGILVVHVEGTTSDNNLTSPEGSFELADGPIDKGVYSYDLFRREENSVGWYLVTVPNERSFAIAKLVTGMQTIWYESTGAWLDRTADLRRTADCPLLPYGVQPSGSESKACYQQRYGGWARGFGGQFDRKDTNTFTAFGDQRTLSGNYDQNLWGFEAGLDAMVMQPSSGYGGLWLGLLTGFVDSDMRFANSDKAETSGAMVGAYGTYIAGPWYADLLLKADLLEIDYKASFAAARASPGSNTLGLRLDTGYRFDLPQRFFLDPEASIGWASTDVDTFSLYGASLNPGGGESLRGRVGLRLGANWISNGALIEPFAQAGVWGEFADDNSAVVTDGPLVFAFTDDFDDTWAEVGGGINYFAGDSSLFFKGDALLGGELTGFNLKGGGRLGW
jgi:hypothetical protein